MAENLDNKLTLPDPVIYFCKWYWKRRGLLYGTIGLNILLGGIVTWAFTDPSGLDKTPVDPFFHHPFGLLTIFLFILFLTVLSGLITRLSAGVSMREVKKQYLAQLETLYELLETTGVPELLMPRKVKLEEVFIPLQFHPSPPLGTYPLSESELEQYYEHRRRGTQEIDRLLLSEKDWEHSYRERESIEIGELWGNLKRDEPYAVIQGYPGMGKSTFLIRIVLSMARRSQGKKDPTMQPTLSPVLMPLFVSLKKYADAREKSGQEDLSLLEFIKLHCAREFAIPTLPICIERWLSHCQCVILLDGLDEISKEEQRKAIQEEIKYFVRTQRHPEKQLTTYNRFLITSRVAGYDQKAFANFPHYLVAYLTQEQIDGFLPRWCLANARRDLYNESEDKVTQRANLMAQRLSNAVQTNPNVRELAENPLLLTLIAAIQQSGVELPTRRVQLYRDVTRIFLDYRNEAKGIPSLPENEAVQRLGLLAFKLHSEGNGFARKEEVLAIFREVIVSPQGGGRARSSAEDAANIYLDRVSERGGLFVRRIGDYYGFFHRTFEEYFAARYLLKRIELDRDRKPPRGEIRKLVDLVRNDYVLWRETFLLAVAYKSDDDATLASAIIRTLFEASQAQGTPNPEQLRDLLLVATSVIESEVKTIDPSLQREIADWLLQTYEQKLLPKESDGCDEIEGVAARWIVSLHRDTEKDEPALPLALYDAIRDVTHPSRQKAALELLATIGRHIQAAPTAVFAILIPPLLSLAHLPAIGPYELDTTFAASPDHYIIDLAFMALSMDNRTTAGSRRILRFAPRISKAFFHR